MEIKKYLALFLAIILSDISAAQPKKHDLWCKTNPPKVNEVLSKVPSSQIFLLPDDLVNQAISKLSRLEIIKLNIVDVNHFIGIYDKNSGLDYYLVRFVSSSSIGFISYSSVGAYYDSEKNVLRIYNYGLGGDINEYRNSALIIALGEGPKKLDVFCLMAQ